MSTISFETAQTVLSTLIGAEEAQPLPRVKSQVLSQWLIQNDLAPLAYHVYGRSWPTLTQHLQSDYFTAVAESSMISGLLDRVLAVLNRAEIPTVILKGVAVSTYAYPQPELRMMSDIDLWIDPQHIQDAAILLEKDGLIKKNKEKAFIQYGKIDLYAPQWVRGAVDLHAQMLAGYWLTTATLITNDALLADVRTFFIRGHHAYRLSAEDALIHAALHVAINHKFDETSLRTLTDVALLTQQNINWSKLLTKAHQWRVQKVLSFVLKFVADLFKVEAIGQHWPQTLLQSSENRLLSTFISPEQLILGRDLSQSAWAYLFHILLLDRVIIDAPSLIWRKLSQK